MDGTAPDSRAIVPRKGPDFGFDGDVPRHWLDNDPFKTRFFDAMSCLFPEGEKFFISCVRDYRDQITDPKLAAEVKDFIYQEGQHGMVHTQFNNRLRAQGVEVDRILKKQNDIMYGFFRKRFPRSFTLGQTAAAEHMTALMAHGFFSHDFMKDADPRVRAMYAWHAVEEIEHKAVAYDVLKTVAKAGYFTRIASFMLTTFTFPFHVFMIMQHMFKVDGVKNKPWVWLKGLWWLYGWNGLYPRLMPHYLLYFLPGFHPWKFGDMRIYETWTRAYAKDGAIAAGDAVALAGGSAA
ncbi:MAG TPA: metal-dependent hydrolase [Nevskiaceae bacterium]|nr:metal-dependent hydrolase [Nevskiaceae bacterium]